MDKQRELYLEILFHDNDFSSDFVEVLSEIWKMIEENNNSRSKEYKTTDLFKELHTKGILLQMIKKAVVLSAAGHDIEWATRMYQGECTQTEPLKSASKEAARFEKYFEKLKIKFHPNNEFISEWRNSEHAALNCRNGNVIIF
jgi:hypothetical protein